MESENSLNKLKKSLDKIVDNISNENGSGYKKELDIEIDKLERLYSELKEYADILKKSKSSIKSISEVYSNLISLSKLITDLKEKKSKLEENDIRLIKSAFEIVNKMQLLELTTSKEADGSIDISVLLKQLN